MNTKLKTKNILAGVLLASGGLFATGASAAPIPAWDWVSSGGFINGPDGSPSAATCSNGGQSDCDLGFSEGVTPTTDPSTSSIITWGEGTSLDNGNGQQSGLQAVFGSSAGGPFDATLLGSDPLSIGGDEDGNDAFEQIITNGGWFNTGAAVHYNNVITQAGGDLTYTVLSTDFQLTGPVGLPPVSTTLDIMFNETENEAGCLDGNPHGTVCDDIFTLTGSLDPISFYVGSQLYKASFQFANGPGAIVDGNTIYTAENSPGTAVVFVQGRIDTIPVPGVLALMGMGLMMVGWRVRRRKLV